MRTDDPAGRSVQRRTSAGLRRARTELARREVVDPCDLAPRAAGRHRARRSAVQLAPAGLPRGHPLGTGGVRPGAWDRGPGDAAGHGRRGRAAGLGRGPAPGIRRAGSRGPPAGGAAAERARWTASGPRSSSPPSSASSGSVVGWVTTAGTNEALVGRLVSASRRRPAVVEDPEIPGVVFVQLDGVPYPVLHMASSPEPSRPCRDGSAAVAISSRVDTQASGDHSGEPDGHPARRDRRHSGLQVVRPRERQGARREPSARMPPSSRRLSPPVAACWSTAA